MAPALPGSYLAQLLRLKSMGAVVLTLALEQSLMPESQTYWLNIPADSPDKQTEYLPVLGRCGAHQLHRSPALRRTITLFIVAITSRLIMPICS